jgi:serine/threonine protein kinase
VPGGELGMHLLKDETFTPEQTKFYVSQVVMALQYMHAEDIIFRGVVLDNLLLDRTGYVKVVDFGLAKRLTLNEEEGVLHGTYTLCGMPEYTAPEMIKKEGHGKGVDWWAIGTLAYEMLAGYPPFFDAEPKVIYTKILQGVSRWLSRYYPAACHAAHAQPRVPL